MNVEESVRREVSKHPGVTYSFDRAHKHHRVILERGGRTRFVVLGATISDWRALANIRRDVRREIRNLDGAGR